MAASVSETAVSSGLTVHLSVDGREAIGRRRNKKWHGNTQVLGEKTFLVSLFAPLIPCNLCWNWCWVSVIKTHLLTAWHTETQFCQFYMGAKLGRSHWGRNVSWGFSRIGCWGGYLGLRGTRRQESGENYTTNSFMFSTPQKHHSGHQIKKTEMDRACSAYGGDKRYIQGFGKATWGKETTCKAQA